MPARRDRSDRRGPAAARCGRAPGGCHVSRGSRSQSRHRHREPTQVLVIPMSPEDSLAAAGSAGESDHAGLAVRLVVSDRHTSAWPANAMIGLTGLTGVELDVLMDDLDVEGVGRLLGGKVRESRSGPASRQGDERRGGRLSHRRRCCERSCSTLRERYRTSGEVNPASRRVGVSDA